MNAITDAIKNLESSSKALESFANKPENYNTDYAGYLELMSWEMLRKANQLKEMNTLYGEG